MKHFKTSLLAFLLSASTALAGGPVITPEEPPEKIRDGRSEGAWVVPVILGLIIIGAAAGGGGGGDVCNGGEPTDPC